MPIIDEKINLAHSTAYMLIRAGVHGSNGLSPVISVHILKTQIIPRLLYGLEATTLSTEDVKKLSMVIRTLLKK